MVMAWSFPERDFCARPFERFKIGRQIDDNVNDYPEGNAAPLHKPSGDIHGALGLAGFSWQRSADGEDPGNARARVPGRRHRTGAGADHRHDVLAADRAGQPAQARRAAALQAPGRAVVGRVRPGGLAGPPAADERGAARGGRRHGQGPDQPGAGWPRHAQAGRQGCQ